MNRVKKDNREREKDKVEVIMGMIGVFVVLLGWRSRNVTTVGHGPHEQI